MPIDYKEALHYFRLAAESGNANAEAFIGRMYAEGVGDLKQDYTVAREYFARAAEQVGGGAMSSISLVIR